MVWQQRIPQFILAIAVGILMLFMASSYNAEAAKAVISLINTLIWPAVFVFAALWFRPEFAKAAERLIELDAFGFKAKLVDEKINNELKRTAIEAEQIVDTRKPPTENQVARAAEVKQILNETPSLIFPQVEQLAHEY